MRTRLLIGPIIIAAIIGIFYADSQFFQTDRPLMSGLIALLAACGWLEFAAITGCGRGGGRSFMALGLVGTLFFHAVAWWSGRGQPGAEIQGMYDRLALAGVLGTVLGAFALVVFRKDYARYYRTALETICGVLLLGVLLSYLVRIYLLPGDGLTLPLIFFIGIKGTDIVAYIVGFIVSGDIGFLGISPKKTVEGCLGAVVWGALWFAVLGWFYEEILFPWPQGILFGIILAIVAQIGDLAESLFKRTYEVKDSGGLLPEFGGVLDMVDSLIFAGWIFWLMLA